MRTFLILLFFVAGFSLARAHAFLDHAEPRVGSTVPAPTQVKIWFTENLEGAFSKIEVFDAAGHEVDKKDSQIDPAEHDIMTVGLPPLPPGSYKVVWHAVATDTHHTMGTFPFEIAKP